MKRARMQLAAYAAAIALLATACLGPGEDAVVVETTPSTVVQLELDAPGPGVGRDASGAIGNLEQPQASPRDDLEASPPEVDPEADAWFPDLPSEAVAAAFSDDKPSTTQASATQASTTPASTATQAPTSQAAGADAPTTQAPVADASTTQAPTSEAPGADAPTSLAPITQAPITQAPITQAPVTEAPVSQAPATQAPVVQPPAPPRQTTTTTTAPATQAPVTQAPVTQAPVTQAPVTQAPTQPPTTPAPTTTLAPTPPPPAPAPAPAPVPTPPRSGQNRCDSGSFRIDESTATILDPSGAAFLPSGFNLSAGYHDDNAFFEASAAEDMDGADVQRMIDVWNVNTIRINISSAVNPNIWVDGELDRVIGLLTDYGIVAMIENHPYGTGLDPTPKQIQITSAGFSTLARRWKNNPCVWFNPFNEPGGKIGDSVYSVNEPLVTGDDAWVDWHTPVIDAIRAHSNTIVVLDDTHFGQGRSGRNYNPDHSALLTYGERLNVRYDNLLYSVHFYDRWEGDSADMRSFIDSMHNKGLALIVGETGGHPTEGAWYTQGYWPTSQALYAMAPRGVGILLWHANVRYSSGMSVGRDFGQRVPVWDVTSRDATDASGRLHWDWAQDLPNPRP